MCNIVVIVLQPYSPECRTTFCLGVVRALPTSLRLSKQAWDPPQPQHIFASSDIASLYKASAE